MLKIKAEKMGELEQLGFEKNMFFDNLVFETRSKKGTQVFINVDNNTRELKGSVCGVRNVPLGLKEISHFAHKLFELDMVEVCDD